MVAQLINCPAPRTPPGSILRPKALRAKLATSRGRPCSVCIELVDGSNHPPLFFMSRKEALRFALDIALAAERLPAGDIQAIEIGAA